MNPHSILITFQRSANVLKMNLDGITHAQSLWTPAPNVNSINWLVGHLVSARTTGLQALGQRPVWDDAIRARYRAGSAPINADGEGVLDLSRLLSDFAEAQRRMEAGLATIRQKRSTRLQPLSSSPLSAINCCTCKITRSTTSAIS